MPGRGSSPDPPAGPAGSGQPQAATEAAVAALVGQRAALRAAGNYAAADGLRRQLAEWGAVVEDGPGGSRWHWAAAAPPPPAPGAGRASAEGSVCARKHKKKNDARRAKRHRARLLADWLVATHGLDHLRQRGVLDVAGGNGKLAYELCVVRGIPCTVVDPRPLQLSAHTTTVLLQRARAWAPDQGLEGCSCLAPGCGRSSEGTVAGTGLEGGIGLDAGRLQGLCGGLQRALGSYLQHIGLRHVQAEFTAHFGLAPPTAALLASVGVLVGLHPDEATDPLVEVALAHSKPFAVVPCCVFPGLFAQRRHCGEAVRSYEQLLDYLQGLGPAIARTMLPGLPGRNVLLYRT